MFPLLMLLFIVVPMVEIGLFIQVGGLLGLWPTIAIVFFTAVIGASLVRSQGIATLTSVQRKLQQGQMPTQEIVEGMLLAVAGVLLLTPGFMTDALGIVLLLPPSRAKIAQLLMRKVTLQHGFNHFGEGFEHHTHSHDAANGDVFDGEYERKDDHNNNNSNHRLP
ncbi:FxsA family protein [Photobacterium carnosum]|uniref:FxsA family protein n=1 Tax=Photobacterium carnosum TaxID=2023717 RepID=UPI00128E43A5|nr:FxsA family protein [Photobacterium carnosum]KAE8175969.1 membrane protein FxsA [Photobacterium carnosum]MCD9527891.1 membrane protein FxsA [Photobacterium carnosum]MCD9538909.1 membrane protein FxsA [Photobacterium carnosum]MCF2163298.1 membrane protein FxsA [Photobacterium carnosum]